MNVDQISNELIEILKKVLKISKINKSIALHEPEFSEKEKEILLDCIETTYVSTNGEYIQKFETEIKKITGVRNAIAVVNGTVAIELALRSVGIKKQQEIFVPALTFVATANAIAYCDAIPHFIDSDRSTLGIDIFKLEKHIYENCELIKGKLINKKTKRHISGIIPVHVFGMSVDMSKIIKIANKFNLIIIEDAAEALGSFWRDKHLGPIGPVGTLSFNGNKIVTTGGGGAVITNSDLLANKIRHISSTAKIPHKWEYIHNEIGWNYRMPNLNAALGYAQMQNFTKILKKKKILSQRYQHYFKNSVNFEYIDQPKSCNSNFWLNSIKISSSKMSLRDSILNKLHNFGFNCRPIWKLLNKLPMYKDCPKSDLSNALELEKTIINLPSSSFHIENDLVSSNEK